MDLALTRTKMLGSYAKQFWKQNIQEIYREHCNVSIRNPTQMEPDKHLRSILQSQDKGTK